MWPGREAILSWSGTSSPRRGMPAGAPALLRIEVHLRHTHGHAHAPALGRGRPLVLGSSPRRPSVAARSLWVLGERGCLAGPEQHGVGARPRLLGTAAPSGRDHPNPCPPTELTRTALAKGKAGMGAVAWEAARHKRPHHAGECSVWPGAPARSGGVQEQLPGNTRDQPGETGQAQSWGGGGDSRSPGHLPQWGWDPPPTPLRDWEGTRSANAAPLQLCLHFKINFFFFFCEGAVVCLAWPCRTWLRAAGEASGGSSRDTWSPRTLLPRGEAVGSCSESRPILQRCLVGSERPTQGKLGAVALWGAGEGAHRPARGSALGREHGAR